MGLTFVWSSAKNESKSPGKTERISICYKRIFSYTVKINKQLSFLSITYIKDKTYRGDLSLAPYETFLSLNAFFVLTKNYSYISYTKYVSCWFAISGFYGSSLFRAWKYSRIFMLYFYWYIISFIESRFQNFGKNVSDKVQVFSCYWTWCSHQ